MRVSLLAALTLSAVYVQASLFEDHGYYVHRGSTGHTYLYHSDFYIRDPENPEATLPINGFNVDHYRKELIIDLPTNDREEENENKLSVPEMFPTMCELSYIEIGKVKAVTFIYPTEEDLEFINSYRDEHGIDYRKPVRITPESPDWATFAQGPYYTTASALIPGKIIKVITYRKNHWEALDSSDKYSEEVSLAFEPGPQEWELLDARLEAMEEEENKRESKKKETPAGRSCAGMGSWLSDLLGPRCSRS